MRIGKNKKANQMMILSILAVSILLVFTPLAIHLLFDWERSMDNLGSSQQWDRIGEEDLETVSFTGSWDDGHSGAVVLLEELQECVGTYEILGNTFPEYDVTNRTVTPQLMAWNDTGMSIILPNPALTTPSSSYGYDDIITHDLAIITNYTISDLLDKDIMQVKISYNSSRPIIPRVLLCSETDGAVSIGGSTIGTYYNYGMEEGNFTFTWDAVDLLEIQLSRGASARLVFFFEGTVDYYQLGDQVQFSIELEDGEDSSGISGWLTQEMILQIGAAVMGGVFIIGGLMATPLWNPSARYNKGPVDKILGWIPVLIGKISRLLGIGKKKQRSKDWSGRRRRRYY